MTRLTSKFGLGTARALTVACVLLASLTAGCGGRTVLGGGSVRVESIDEGTALRPTLRLRAYQAHDKNTADIYLTDLTPEQLEPTVDPTTLAGSIVHVHMFIRPRPGRTPIEGTASTAAIRHVVLANGEVGVYSGGGFMLPSGNAGDGRFGGRISRASLKLTRATDGFNDLLGAAEFSGSISAPLDDAMAAKIEALLEEAAAQTRPR
ncbi:MAG: hypothetical protein KIS87_05790 [Phycisphaeraceae bacterium]|nr:hypothetical protein [Phycisphaeraceae bacterium]